MFSSWRLRLRGLLAAFALMLAATPVVHAAGGVDAGPRAYMMTRGSGYATGQHELLTPMLVLAEGTQLTFVNLHIWGHSIMSDAWKAPDQRLFGGDVIPFGKSTLVHGVEALAPGTYGFFCSNHSGMRGELVILDSTP